MRLESEYSLVVQPYPQRAEPLRLSVGDVIRCDRFRIGIRYNGQDKITVGWKDTKTAEAHASRGRGELCNDESRGTAPFVVIAVKFVEDSGPDDGGLGFRISTNIRCLRVTEEMQLLPNAELIQFSKFEPMSMVQPLDESINLVGYAKMPIGDNGGMFEYE